VHLPRYQKELVSTAQEDCIVVDGKTNQTELRDQITQLLIESPLPLDQFLNLEDKTIVDDIFAAIIKCYSVNQPGKEKESSDKEEVKQIKDAKELR
jgi:hypothetical protein